MLDEKNFFYVLKTPWLNDAMQPSAASTGNIKPQSPISTQIHEIDEKFIKSAQESATAALERLLESELPALLVPVVGNAFAEATECEAVGDASVQDGLNDVARLRLRLRRGASRGRG